MNRMFTRMTRRRNQHHCQHQHTAFKRVVAGVIFGWATLLFCGQLIASTLVNINTASAEHIADALQGIGAVKAEAIVAYRDANGLFKTPEDIMQVKGIGQTTYEQIKAFLLIESAAVSDTDKLSSHTSGGEGQLAGINTAKE